MIFNMRNIAAQYAICVIGSYERKIYFLLLFS
jgi:hypothetical protein